MTRAQEAEENYIIKRELAVVKQRCSSATENLQRAQSTIRQLQDQQVGVPKRPQVSPSLPEPPRVSPSIPKHPRVSLSLPGCPPSSPAPVLAVSPGGGHPRVTPRGRWQGNPRFSEEFVTHLETELEQSRLRESETLGALKEMQDKVLDMEKVGGGLGAGDPGVGDSHTKDLGDSHMKDLGVGDSPVKVLGDCPVMVPGLGTIPEWP